MIMVISMRNAFLVPIIFTILPSLHPPSFHEMIFILVIYIYTRKKNFFFIRKNIMMLNNNKSHKIINRHVYKETEERQRACKYIHGCILAYLHLP